MPNKRAAKPKAQVKPKAATKRLPLPGASPISGVPPPEETRFKVGNKAGVGHGRPRTLSQLRELVQEIAAEPVESSPKWTRLYLMLRGMFASKANSDRQTVLEYGFGKVPNENRERTYEDDIIDLLLEHRITEEQLTHELPDDAPRLIATAKLRSHESGETQTPIE